MSSQNTTGCDIHIVLMIMKMKNLNMPFILVMHLEVTLIQYSMLEQIIVQLSSTFCKMNSTQ